MDNIFNVCVQSFGFDSNSETDFFELGKDFHRKYDIIHFEPIDWFTMIQIIKWESNVYDVSIVSTIDNDDTTIILKGISESVVLKTLYAQLT